MKRAIYLSYYIKQLDRQKFSSFLNYAIRTTGMARLSILSDLFMSVFKYNIAILEYFQFRFFELDEEERKKWAGTGCMYEFQRRMNPLSSRQILENKTLFYKKYKDFFLHQVAGIEDLKAKPHVVDSLLSNPSGKMVFKLSTGKCGAQVEIRNCKDFNQQSIIEYIVNSEYGLVEEFITQHPVINKLAPSAVNTVRIITQLNDEGDVEILGCRLRISLNSQVDNMAAGNLAAPIDEDTGLINGPGVYSDITKSEQEYHPVTEVRITGFQIPFWEETLQMVKKVALLHPQNRSIGWDVVITDEGPGLIEGNHDWCKLLWQLPVKTGLKSSLNNTLN